MIKKQEILILILVALIIPLSVLWENTFPEFSYYLKKANGYGLMIRKESFNENTFLLNSHYKNNPFGRVELKMKIDESFVPKLKQPVAISIYENYETMIYPKEGEINSVEEFKKYLFFENQSIIPNGTIFSNGESAFFVSRGKYLPILSSEIFEQLGFDWDFVIPQETGIFSTLAGEGEKIVFSSVHPDGVVLETKEGIYLIWEKKLIKIRNEEILKEAWEQYYTIPASELFELDSCSPVIESTGEISCDFNVADSSGLNHPYIFKINQANLDPMIVDAETKLKVSTQLKDVKKAFFVMLSNAKRSIANKYGGYLF